MIVTSNREWLQWSEEADEYIKHLTSKSDCSQEEVAKAIKEKPAVKVLIDGRIIVGYPKGKHGRVIVNIGHETEVLQFTWESIARSAYHGEVLIG